LVRRQRLRGSAEATDRWLRPRTRRIAGGLQAPLRRPAIPALPVARPGVAVHRTPSAGGRRQQRLRSGKAATAGLHADRGGGAREQPLAALLGPCNCCTWRVRETP